MDKIPLYMEVEFNLDKLQFEVYVTNKEINPPKRSLVLVQTVEEVKATLYQGMIHTFNSIAQNPIDGTPPVTED
jgi:hypothetical protein